ncbi:MAG TPA: UDP-glucose 6-dehydrogenase, partial [Sphingobacteriaceae bacterium]|nr:UDP-glucose 6-dehydrogenase [Sphingobacteriaceae bacterium]
TLVQSAAEYQYEFKILNSVLEVNMIQKRILVEKMKKYYKNDLKNKKFAVWGLAFKPETDDIREAPALEIIDALLGEGAKVTAFDPEAMGHVKKIFRDKIEFAENQYDALKDVDALVIVTEWSLFRNPDFERMESLLKNKVIFDGRNLYDLQKMIELGYYYNSIGRKIVQE